MPEESIRHALTGYVYTRREDGSVRVHDPASSREGIFSPDGAWVSGEITYVDHHMLGHMRGARARQAGAYGRGGTARPATAAPADKEQS